MQPSKVATSKTQISLPPPPTNGDGHVEQW